MTRPPAVPHSRLLAERLLGELGRDVVTDRHIDRAKMAHDASHYLLTPQAVVLARDTADVERAVRIAHDLGVPVTFRSGGTSLSGQAVSDGLLIDTRRSFRDVEVLDDGARVRCQPGATVRNVNARLAPYSRALGPDPASEIACTVGGVVANNSSGMACGTVNNTYRTLDAIEVVLLSGTRVDTADPDADERLRAAEPELWQGLVRLRDQVRGNPESVRRIEHQFSMKNTMGYGLNAFLDHDSPAQILAHLMVGSEGTLGFIASATFRTVPVNPRASTALLIFDDISAATDALPHLIEAGTATAELLDAASLRVAQGLPHPVHTLRSLRVAAHTALLVEAQAQTADELGTRVSALTACVDRLDRLAPPSGPSYFSEDPTARAQAWSVRKGLYTAVASARPSGSTALLEDVVVPMPALTQMVADLHILCERHGYDDTVVFGHAKDANLHFMINPDLRDEAQLDTYARFSDELVDLVLAADGSLKAEHGTGRIMAPFVRRQYGDELYEVMREVKVLFDPSGTLNPGVIITDDDRAHLRHLKVPTLVDPAVDVCVECGYCEPTCPSKDLTTTPRQRIVLMREMAADPHGAATMAADFSYEAVQTCAVDSLCVLACPVGIDTGKVMKSHRYAAQPPAVQSIAAGLADNWGRALTLLRGGLTVAEAVPAAALTGLTGTARRALPTDLIPLVGEDLPGPGLSRRTTARTHPGEVVFFASCMSELFGPADSGTPGAALAVLALCDRAGVTVRLPDGLHGLCCGTVWRSKGLTEGRGRMAVRTATALLAATEGGRVPVITEASSCTHGLHEVRADLLAAGETELAAQVSTLTIIDATRFVHDVVLPKLLVRRRLASLVVHPTCSDRHAGDVDALVGVAQACADHVDLPVDAGCCAFAGDRGLLHPELTASATRREAAEVGRTTYDAYLSTNRTCELGLSRATGRTYRHVLELLDELTRDPEGERRP